MFQQVLQVIDILPSWLGPSWSKKTGMAIFALYVVTHILDGLLTYVGLEHSHASECNFVGLYLFGLLGLIPGIVVIKITAVTLGLFLYRLRLYLPILIVTAVGIYFAIIQWILTLSVSGYRPWCPY